jgi:energy-coupling factor transport system permease protein
MRDIFSTYHPIVNFLYFTWLLVFTMFFMHPVALIISLLSAITYSVYLKGKKAVHLNFGVLLPVIVITALINPAFNHRGVTILTYLPNGNPLTLESIVYGIAAGTMLSAVIGWFSCFNEVMTSDKFIYLFGRLIPALSLVLSMALRFVPKFSEQIKEISNAQKVIGRDVSNGRLIERARHGLSILSIMITWALENSIETADSMRSRGYGLPKRTFFSIYRFEKRDKKALSIIILLGFYILLGGFTGAFNWNYFPFMGGKAFDLYSGSVWLAYLLLSFMPIMINKEGERQWEASQLKT